MKTRPLPSPRNRRNRAFTLIELLTVTAIIAVLSAAIFPGVKASMRNAQMNAAMQNARQVAMALRNYAGDFEGTFPPAVDLETEEEYSNSNEVFRNLFIDFIDSERVFAVTGSAWGPQADGRIDEESEVLEPGENHWAYIAGLTTTSRSDWPLLVDGSNGEGGYGSLQTEKCGLWEGSKAIVVRVEAVLRRAETRGHQGSEPGENECRFGDFVLDRPSRSLRRIGGEEVDLSPKEYGLLDYFCQRAGRALGRDEIMDEVWGYDSRVTSRSIDRFVTSLRKKIEADPEHPRIETIREYGYRFRV